MSLPKPVNEEPTAHSASEIRGELQRSLASSKEWALRAWRETLAEVEQKQAGYVPPGERDDLAALRENTQFAITAFERIGHDDPVWLEHQAPTEYSWTDITHEMKRDEATGWSLWAKVRQTARDELASGAMAGQAIEGYHPRPYERAAFLAVREALADGLQPR